MQGTRKVWRKVVYIVLLVAAVCLLFWGYSTANNRRIREQNLSYAMDSVRQSVLHVKGEFDSALRQIRSDAYFVDETLTEPDISQEFLGRMERNTGFDALRFTDLQGITYSSGGETTDSSDREFFLKGIRGESGISVIMESRITGEAMINFYTPLYFDGKIFGVLRGIYSAEKYLHNMLVTSYFGKAADVYLCTADGMVIAATAEGDFERPLLEAFLESGAIDAATAESAQGVFEGFRREGAFICDYGSTTDNLCLSCIPGCDYVLVQTFPRDVTQSMVRAANYNGIILQALLGSIFVFCALMIWFRARSGRIGLERENLDMGYITASVNTLFTYFVLVDLEKNAYRYLNNARPKRIDFPVEGDYENFIPYISSFLANKEDGQKVREHLERDAVIQNLGSSTPGLQYEYEVIYNDVREWMQCSIICLERRDGIASKAMYLWQNVTTLKEREQRAKKEVSMVNRRTERYIATTLTDAFCIYEINITHDRIESVSVSRHVRLLEEQFGKGVVAELEAVGVKSQCRATLWFDAWKRFVKDEYVEDYSAWASVINFMDSYARGETETIVEFWTKEVKGKALCVRLSCYIMEDEESGDIIGLVIAKEITGQVRQQQKQVQALQDVLRQAQRANIAKSTFLSNMSHDIRTPMNAIIGYSNIAISNIENHEQVQNCLMKVLSSSNHLLNLINDILDMSRIENGKMQINEQPCNLHELIRDLFNILHPQIMAKNLELSTNTFHVTDDDVITDSLKLCQIFVNLLGNAVKYTPAGGKIVFDIYQKSAFNQDYGDYTFIVRDNGIGMAPEFIEHIFEPFERETSVTKNGIRGAGLGMTITKHIVDMLGGTIEVRSKKGEGSEFQVDLRLKLQDPEKKTAQIEQLQGLRVLVVDDDLDSCESVCRMLREIGARAEWVPQGEEAVMRAEHSYREGTPYNVYIIDWQMPGMGGIEVTERIRAIAGKEIPIIIMTAYDWTDIETEARQAGATDFCAKPLFMSGLKAVLLSAIHPASEPEGGADARIDFKGKRVLLVDDNEMNREIAEAVLLEAGFVVETAPDGIDAVEMVRRSEEYYYDAILTDIQMPIMDGYEEARTIRSMDRKDVREIPLIAVSANGMEEDKKLALENGIDAWLDKPLYADAFIDKLKKILNNN